jgi:acyl carrier protein
MAGFPGWFVTADDRPRMSSAEFPAPSGPPAPPASSPTLSAADPEEARLRETLKRCPPETLAAACQFRRTGDPGCVGIILRGVIARYVEPARRALVPHAGPDLRLGEDLGLDSLSLMEIVLLAEEVLEISVTDEELRRLRTLGDVQQFMLRQLAAAPLPRRPSSPLHRPASS